MRAYGLAKRHKVSMTKGKIGNLTTPDFWSDVTCVGKANAA